MDGRMSFKEEILDVMRQNKGLFKKYGVCKMGLFGSFVKNKNKKTSDVDVLVEFNKATFDNYIGLRAELEEKLHKKIDLVSIKALKRRIKQYILKEIEWI